ncbi:hypothetical protein LTS08_002344 [Lithohypha guttulata]|nr:hypothetical protein LTS08_002344 [Lithohypha guttulata]
MKLSAVKWLAYLTAMASWKTPTPTQDLATQPSTSQPLNPREENAANAGGPFWPFGFPTTNIFITDDGPVELTEARLGTSTQTLTIDVTRNTIMRTTTVTGTDLIAEPEEPDILTTTPPAEPLDETSTTTSHEASSTTSSSESSTTSRSTSTSSSSSSISSTTTSTSSSSTSSSSTASACAYGPLSLPTDIDKTISAWMAQFPFTILTTSETTSTTTSSSTSTPSTTTSSKGTSASKETTPSTITPAPSTAASFVAPHVPPFVPDADPAFSSSLSAESVSRAASVSSAAAAEATSICQHWGVKSFPKDIPFDWLPKTDQTDDGYLCVAEPDKTNIDKDIWGTDWELQPFSIDNGWEDTDPDQTLVEEFCDMLVDNSVDVTYDGKVQGACAVYSRGACIREENGECAMYEHKPVAANEATVVFAVTYKANSPKCGEEHNKSTNYVDMGRKKCKEKLNKNLINKCKFDKKPKQDSNVYKSFPVLGGTYWDGCMQYTIVAVKNPPKAGF